MMSSDSLEQTMRKILREFFYEGNDGGLYAKFKSAVSVQTILRDYNPNNPELLAEFMRIWNYNSSDGGNKRWVN